MIKFHNRSWRKDLATIATSANQSILIVAPFIKYAETVWFCEKIHPDIEVVTLTNIESEAVSASALDLTALRHLAEVTPSAKLVALPNLHAKVYVADEKAAIVTSGNLTRSALDSNIEYGVLLHDPDLIRTVRRDMLSFTQLGSRVNASTIADLIPLEDELRQARAGITSNAAPDATRKFDEVMRRARSAFASMQVGNRSAHAVFSDAIQFVLVHDGPQTTKVIQEEVRRLMPTLCDDSEYFYIKGERYGKTWKRRLRHAQQHLKRRGIIIYNANKKTWGLIRS